MPRAKATGTAKSATKPKTVRKRQKKVKDVIYDTSAQSGAIDQVEIKDQKVLITFQGRDTQYTFNCSILPEFVKEVEKFVSEEHLSLGKYYNQLVKDGQLTQV